MDIDAMRNGDMVQSRYRDEAQGPMYIPWMVVLDKTGKPLITSDGPDGAIAMPQGSEKNREWFLAMLRQTAPDVTEEELRTIDQVAKAFHDRLWAEMPASALDF